MRAFITLLAFGLAAVAAVPTKSNRIVGGELTTIQQYPQTAALLYSSSGNYFSQSCGGTIITSTCILTAAHCIINDQPYQWRVRVGSSFASSGGSVHALSRIVPHESYNRVNFDNDIAILHVSVPFVFSDSVKAGSVAGSAYNLADNQPVWAAGWGSTAPGGWTVEQLRHVQVWSVNQAVCRERYASVRLTVTNNMLCSGWLDVGGRDQCQGDSGGPLFHNGVVVGVCSWGRSCALGQFPGVNARVSQYTSWIQRNC